MSLTPPLRSFFFSGKIPNKSKLPKGAKMEEKKGFEHPAAQISFLFITTRIRLSQIQFTS